MLTGCQSLNRIHTARKQLILYSLTHQSRPGPSSWPPARVQSPEPSSSRGSRTGAPKGGAACIHTFRGLEETDTRLDLGPVDAFLLRCPLYRELEQLDRDDVMVVYRANRIPPQDMAHCPPQREVAPSASQGPAQGEWFSAQQSPFLGRQHLRGWGAAQSLAHT